MTQDAAQRDMQSGAVLSQLSRPVRSYLNQESLALRSHSVSCFSASSLATP